MCFAGGSSCSFGTDSDATDSDAAIRLSNAADINAAVSYGIVSNAALTLVACCSKMLTPHKAPLDSMAANSHATDSDATDSDAAITTTESVDSDAPYGDASVSNAAVGYAAFTL